MSLPRDEAGWSSSRRSYTELGMSAMRGPSMAGYVRGQSGRQPASQADCLVDVSLSRHGASHSGGGGGCAPPRVVSGSPEHCQNIFQNSSSQSWRSLTHLLALVWVKFRRMLPSAAAWALWHMLQSCPKLLPGAIPEEIPPTDISPIPPNVGPMPAEVGENWHSLNLFGA